MFLGVLSYWEGSASGSPPVADPPADVVSQLRVGTPWPPPQARRSDRDEAMLAADDQDAEDLGIILATILRTLH